MYHDPKEYARVTHPTDLPNFCIVHLPKISIAFSYETPIAYSTAGTGWQVTDRSWSKTTGKHLNYMEDDKKKRIPNEEWEEGFMLALGRRVLANGQEVWR